MKKSKKFDDNFILIEAEDLSMGDEFMQYTPRTKREEATKNLICEAIRCKVKNFYRPKYDPAFNLTARGRIGVLFDIDKEPAVEVGYDFWVDAANNYDPKHNSRLGNRLEYVAFLGVLIKKFVAAGKSLEWAWNVVCNDSKEIGNYLDSKDYEPFADTGSKGAFEFYDLGNTYKILADEYEGEGFWLAGGCCFVKGSAYPLAAITYHCDYIDGFYNSVGWIVCS